MAAAIVVVVPERCGDRRGRGGGSGLRGRGSRGVVGSGRGDGALEIFFCGAVNWKIWGALGAAYWLEWEWSSGSLTCRQLLPIFNHPSQHPSTTHLRLVRSKHCPMDDAYYSVGS